MSKNDSSVFTASHLGKSYKPNNHTSYGYVDPKNASRINLGQNKQLLSSIEGQKESKLSAMRTIRELNLMDRSIFGSTHSQQSHLNMNRSKHILDPTNSSFRGVHEKSFLLQKLFNDSVASGHGSMVRKPSEHPLPIKPRANSQFTAPHTDYYY